MADYFPLISRAVSGLEPNTEERRLAIYVRAKEALDRQLTNLNPPIAPEDLARERAALDAAIMRIEAQFAAAPAAPAVPQPPPVPPTPQVARPQPPVVPPAPPAAPTPRPQPPVSVPAPPITSAAIPRPQPPVVPPAPTAAPMPRPQPPAAPVMPSRPVVPANETVLAPSITSASIPRPQPPAPVAPRPVTPAAPPRPAPAPQPPATPASEGFVHVPAGGTHIIIDPTENEAIPDVPSRPKVTSEMSRGFAKRKGLILAIAIGVPAFLGVGALAYLLRDDPGLYRQQEKEQAGGDASGNAQRKASGRLDGSGSAPASGPRRTPAPENAPLPVATRVVYFEELPDDARGKQSDGQVVWRLETLPGGTGAAPATAVRGSVTIADAKMSMEMLIRVNRESTLPASHTVEVTFKPLGERAGVLEIGPIEARDQETQAGYQLKGAMVPVGENLFLVGLDKTDQALAKNIEAMRDRRWFAFQFRLKDNRIGAILVEKGPTGDRVFKEAIDSWSK